MQPTGHTTYRPNWNLLCPVICSAESQSKVQCRSKGRREQKRNHAPLGNHLTRLTGARIAENLYTRMEKSAGLLPPCLHLRPCPDSKVRSGGYRSRANVAILHNGEPGGMPGGAGCQGAGVGRYLCMREEWVMENECSVPEVARRAAQDPVCARVRVRGAVEMR